MRNQTFEIEPLIQDYLAAWNAPDSTQRALLIDKVLAPDCIYADSHLLDLVETKELHGQFIDRFRGKFADLQISLVSAIDAHHNFFRFRWQLAKASGEVFTQGMFFGEIDQNQKISKLVGFVE